MNEIPPYLYGRVMVVYMFCCWTLETKRDFDLSLDCLFLTACSLKLSYLIDGDCCNAANATAATIT
jgi:hypothetical protein